MPSDWADTVCRCGTSAKTQRDPIAPNGLLGGLRGRMMSIGKLAAGPGAGRYYIDQVAQGREDYYAGEGEAAGVWMGTGAASLELSGEVGENGLARLLDGRDPVSGLLLRRAQSSSPVAGFDLTFRAPKSVSVLF